MQGLKNQFTEASMKNNTDDVVAISYEQLLSSHLSPGDVFFSLKKDTLKKVLSAGENVELSLVPKLYNKGITNFFIKYKINVENTELLSSIFQNYLNASNEEERLSLRLDFISWYSKYFWKDSERDLKENCQLDLIHSLNDAFLFLPDSILNDLQDYDLKTYYRSFEVGAHLFSLALLFGHTDPMYLKELYNIALLFDYGLHKNNLSYHFLEATKAERLKPGQGIEHLKSNGCSQKDINFFCDHPQIGYNQLENVLDENFVFYELGQLILIHQETAKGLGFPNKLAEQDLLLIECLVILCEKMIPHQEKSQDSEKQPLLKKYIANLDDQNNHLYVPIKRLMGRMSDLLTNIKEAV